MHTRRSTCLAAGLAVLLLLQLAAVPAAGLQMRGLRQWYGDPWAGSGGSWGGWGSYWGPGSGWGRYNPDPVGSGCYHPETLQRYRSGQTAWCSSGDRIYCYNGRWQGDCSTN